MATVDARVGASLVLHAAAPPDLGVVLDSIRAWATGPVLVHVNEDADGTAERLQRDHPDLEVTGSQDNRGFCQAHNTLIAQAWERGAEAVVVHNPDLVLDSRAAPALMEAAAAHGRPVLLGPLLLRTDSLDCLSATASIDSAGIRWTASSRHLDRLQGLPAEAAPTSPMWVDGISGACLLVTRSTYDAIVRHGGELFDEEFIAYREDAELALRAARLGIPSLLVPSARGWHVRSQRGTERGRNAWVDLLGVRNRFLLAAKHGRHRPGRLLPTLTRDVVVVLATLTVERSSLPGLLQAWQLRGRMRHKGRSLARSRLQEPLVSAEVLHVKRPRT